MQNPKELHKSFELDADLITKHSDISGMEYIEGAHRKRAGRPRGPKQPPCLVIRGNSLGRPMQSDYSHEFLLSNPLVKTIALLKSLVEHYKIANVTLQFKPGGLYITETTQKTRGLHGYLSFFFDARYINYYYCKHSVNVLLTRDVLVSLVSVVKSETHYFLWRLRPLPEDPSCMILVTNVHVQSELIEEKLIAESTVRVADMNSIVSLPDVDDYYMIAFKTANGTFKNFSKPNEQKFIRIQKSANTPLTISQRDNLSIRIVIPDKSSNIVYNHIEGDSVLSINMPVDIMQMFCQQSDIGNNLQVSLHPIDPITLSYVVENTQIETQYRLAKNHTFQACKISILTPHILEP